MATRYRNPEPRSANGAQYESRGPGPGGNYLYPKRALKAISKCDLCRPSWLRRTLPLRNPGRRAASLPSVHNPRRWRGDPRPPLLSPIRSFVLTGNFSRGANVVNACLSGLRQCSGLKRRRRNSFPDLERFLKMTPREASLKPSIPADYLHDTVSWGSSSSSKCS